MRSYVGVKYSGVGQDINSTDGYFIPLLQLRHKLPKDITELDGWYLGNGHDTFEEWHAEYDKVVEKVLKYVEGNIVEKHGDEILIKCGKPLGEQFGQYLLVHSGNG